MSANKSESIGNLAKALSNVLVAIQVARFDSSNPFIGNKFASLGAVIEVIRPHLKENGLSYTQLIGGDEARISVTTIVMHESGEFVESTVSLPVIDEKDGRKSQAQVAGSVVTYLRRYSLSAAFGVYADEDVDGNKKASGATMKQQGQRPAKPAAEPITLEAAMEIKTPAGNTIGSLNDEQVFALSKTRAKNVTDLMRQAAAAVYEHRQLIKNK